MGERLKALLGIEATDRIVKKSETKKNSTIPKNAEIGGSVGIHGVPKGMDYLIDLKYNWTLGCISLKNNDVNETYPYINKNTVIEIRK
jgi:hypothetical protein